MEETGTEKESEREASVNTTATKPLCVNLILDLIKYHYHVIAEVLFQQINWGESAEVSQFKCLIRASEVLYKPIT